MLNFRSISLLFVGALTVWSSGVFAAIDRRIAPLEKKHVYINNGSITGGTSSLVGLSVLDLRRIFSPKDKIERMIIDMGNDKGQPLLGKVGYFQVSIDKDLPRVVIDLSQMVASSVDQKKIKKMFESSPFVKEAKINFDPVDLSITVQLTLKKKVLLEVFQMPSRDRAARLVVDLKGV